MSDKGNVFSSGGGGTLFEQYVQTAFVTTLIINGRVPCFPSNEILEIYFQTKNKGYETDDLLISTKSNSGVHKLLIQIKHNLVFSKGNKTFKEVIKAFWNDYNKETLFDKTRDRLVIITNGLTKNERNHLKPILNWAKTHLNDIDFLSEINGIKVKKENLDLFIETLKEANNNIPLDEKELWSFLKCLEILEYDFLNENSVAETNFLNLIKLTKTSLTVTSEKEIWDSIIVFVSKLNKDGGSVSFESIKKESVFKYFDLEKLNSQIKLSIDKLIGDGRLILNPLKNSIKEFHLERSEIKYEILESINSVQFTIVTGLPGVGKSAIVKDILAQEFIEANIFVFRADQFNKPHIANVLAGQGIKESLKDIFSYISLMPNKVIFIDSLEKLLEGDPENAFKQLLYLLKEFPTIKLIGTARKYSIDLLRQKFGIETNYLRIIEVNPLNDSEINSVLTKFPQLVDLFKNVKIKKLLQSLKYLEFAIRSINKTPDNYVNVSLIEFKNKLWNDIVEDIHTTKDGLAGKRRKAFLNIAIKRAREMSLFVEPDKDIDLIGVEALLKDEIIYKDKSEYIFSPSHDILEDWALGKYISSVYHEHWHAREFFSKLGNEPAIRRAFRLWVEDYLVEDKDKVLNLVREVIKDSLIEKYWASELTISIFKSDDCAVFFQVLKEELLDEDAKFLSICLHCLRTACKEGYTITDKGNPLLHPVGSGWGETIGFINKNKSTLDSHRLLIINMLFDWSWKLVININGDLPKESGAVKEILLHYLKQIEDEDGFWQQSHLANKQKEIVKLLYNLTSIAKKEITELIERAINNEKNKGSLRLKSFYKAVIDSALSGFDGLLLAKELPKLIINLANNQWKIKTNDEQEFEGIRHTFLKTNSWYNEELWGIVDKHSFFPSGVYKTPIRWLLNSDPDSALKFVTEFLNYSIDFYVKVESTYKQEITQIDLQLNDGKVIKQWAAWNLWAAYRGISVTHYAIECILMSLEDYLLEIAKLKTEESRKYLGLLFDRLLRNSNNVTIASVLTSVSLAYPEEVGVAMLPLLSVKEFYNLDLNRALQEMTTLAAPDSEISYAQNMRHKSNQLIHRRKYMRGLQDFIIDYQMNIREINSSIHAIFDRLKLFADEDDIVWKKTLTEIDSRNWEVSEFDEKAGRFIIQPKYGKDVSEFINSNKEYKDSHDLAARYSNLIRNFYEKKEQMNFPEWEECYFFYSIKDAFDFLFDRPVTLAVLGLTEFKDELSADQKNWCIKIISNCLTSIINVQLHMNIGIYTEYNLLEKKIALKSFHLLYGNAEDRRQRELIIAKAIYMLFIHFNDDEAAEITKYFRTTFFVLYPVEAKIIWRGLIKYSEFKKKYIEDYYLNDEEKERIKKKEDVFINKLSQDVDLKLDIKKINFKKNSAHLLAKVLIITPFVRAEIIHIEFIKRIIYLVIEDLKLKESYSFNDKNNTRQLQYNSILEIEHYLAEVLLYSYDFNFSKSVIDLLLEQIYDNKFIASHLNDDLIEFPRKIFEYIINKVDSDIARETDDKINIKVIDNFWAIWDYLFQKALEASKFYFSSSLLLDTEIGWKIEARDWKPLAGKKAFYYKMLMGFRSSNVKSLLKILSTIGDKPFLPDGLNWLMDLINKNQEDILLLSGLTSERLIKRLFYYHVVDIKNNKQLINNFVLLLDIMVDLGSSEAYLFRENVITYKTNGG